MISPASDALRTDTVAGYPGNTPRAASQRAEPGALPSWAAGLEGQLDTIQFSNSSGLLSGEALILPTAANVRALSARLSNDLAALLRDAGIPAQPPIELDVDETDGRIRVKSSRPDAGQIEALLNGTPAIRKEIQTVAAIASHASQVEASLEFHRAYMASSDPERVVAEYRHLFGPRQRQNLTLRFDGSLVEILSDGDVWLASNREP